MLLLWPDHLRLCLWLATQLGPRGECLQEQDTIRQQCSYPFGDEPRHFALQGDPTSEPLDSAIKRKARCQRQRYRAQHMSRGFRRFERLLVPGWLDTAEHRLSTMSSCKQFHSRDPNRWNWDCRAERHEISTTTTVTLRLFRHGWWSSPLPMRTYRSSETEVAGRPHWHPL